MHPHVAYYLWIITEPPAVARTIQGEGYYEFQRWDSDTRRWVHDPRLPDATSGMSSNDAWVDWISEEDAIRIQPELDTSLCRVAWGS